MSHDNFIFYLILIYTIGFINIYIAIVYGPHLFMKYCKWRSKHNNGRRLFDLNDSGKKLRSNA